MLVISVLAEALFRSGRGGTIVVPLSDVAGSCPWVGGSDPFFSADGSSAGCEDPVKAFTAVWAVADAVFSIVSLIEAWIRD